MDLTLIEQTLRDVLKIPFLDSENGEDGLAAEDTVTRLRRSGDQADGTTDALNGWVSTHRYIYRETSLHLRCK